MVVSLSDLNKKAQEEQEQAAAQGGNEYYSGGASAGGGGSGLNVMAPGGGGGGDNNDFMAGILNRARNEATSTAPEGPVVNVVFYSNGFTLDDGPLRESGIPENDRFLASIKEGICPPELVRDGKAATLALVDKTQEAFKPPAFTAFSGDGQSAGNTDASTKAYTITPQVDAVAPVADDAQPKVRIQLVFENRKRVVVNLNTSHTVRDLAAVVDASGHINGPYQLLTSTRGPPAPITDLTQNLGDAGLNGSAVNVKSV